MKLLTIALAAAIVFASSTQAADIANDVRKGSNGPDSSDGGYLEVGVTMFIHEVNTREGNFDLFGGFGLVLAGAYRYKGFFAEASQGSVDGLNLGYNVWNGDGWAVDILGASVKGNITTGRDDVNLASLADNEREQAVLDRDTFYNGAGVRVTGYLGNAIFQYRLVTDTHNKNGVTSSARIGYSRQLRNWNFHSVIGVDYASKQTSQYWYGVSEEEASARFAQSDVSSSINYSVEVGATYPISENIVFRTTARDIKRDIDSDATNVPSRNGLFGARINTSISYVF